MRLLRSGIAALALCACAAESSSQELPPLTVEGGFPLDDDGAGNFSGIAGVPQAGPDRAICFVANDEEVKIQRVSIVGDVVRAGEEIRLPLPTTQNTFGRPPDGLATRCAEVRNPPKEFDREAISRAADGYFHVVGSHGCSRKKHRYDAWGFLVTRFRVDAQGQPSDVQYSYQFVAALRDTAPFGAHFGDRLMPTVGPPPTREQGLNVEGAVVIGDRLYAGLRAPSLSGRAFLVGVPMAALFGNAAPPAPLVREINLGAEVGIRDLVALASGDLLVLGGPTEEQANVRYGLYRVDAADAATLVQPINGATGAKAEAVLVLEDNAQGLNVVVMFDGPPNADPRRYRIQAH